MYVQTYTHTYTPVVTSVVRSISRYGAEVLTVAVEDLRAVRVLQGRGRRGAGQERGVSLGGKYMQYVCR